MLRPKISKKEIIREGSCYLVCTIENTLYKKNRDYEIKIPENTQPLICYTATTGMIEVIGRMISGHEAEGYHQGKMKRFPINNINGWPKGERVIISEHLKLDGTLEFLATKYNISCGELNFVNLGYEEGDNRTVKLIVDVITGEHKWQ